MKKILATILCLTMGISVLAGCTNDKPKDAKSETKVESSNKPNENSVEKESSKKSGVKEEKQKDTTKTENTKQPSDNKKTTSEDSKETKPAQPNEKENK